MINKEQISDFKGACKENEIIASIVKQYLFEEIDTPILDVGAGFGDIAKKVFFDRQVILLDVIDFKSHPESLLHRRIVSDFLSIDKKILGEIGCLCFFHSIQFLDKDVTAFKEKIKEINPKQIIVAFNKNDGEMGSLVDFFKEEIIDSNPEIFNPNLFPIHYKEKKSFDFDVDCVGNDFFDLTRKVCYLMDCQPNEIDFQKIFCFIRKKLSRPVLNINQTFLFLENEQ